MALAETAKLAVDLSLKGNFSSALAANQRALTGFNAKITDTQGRAYKAGQQIGTGIRRGALIAVAAVGALVPLLVSLAKEGQTAANVELIFSKAVANSGKVSAAQVIALRSQQQALLELAGVDDELIKTEQTRLIQMGLTGAQVQKITPLILDFSKATGVDLLTATKLVGKAVQGNTGALSRYGVTIDKAKAKTDPFAASVDALNTKFGGTSKVLSGSLNTRLDVLREKLANIREEAGIKLLPVFTRIVDVVGSRLVPAFGKLIDTFLPHAIAGLNKLADFLDKGGATDGINSILSTIKEVMPAIVSGAKITGQVISTAVNLFKSLPPEIQGLAVAGLAINKLTGGLVTNIAGGLISSVLKQLVSGVVNVQGAVVNVNGAAGVGGVAAGAGKGSGALGTALKLLPWVGFGVLIGEGFLQGNANNDADRAAGKPLFYGTGNTPAKFGGSSGGSTPSTGPGNVPILANGFNVAGQMAPASGIFGRATDAIRGLMKVMATETKKIPTIVEALRQTFRTDLAALIHATKAADISRNAKKVAAEIAKGVGNVDTTKNVLSTLRKQLANTHDPALQRTLRDAIAKVERRLPGREFAAKQLAKADALLRDGKVTNSDLKTLQGIERSLKDRGLPHAAQVIREKINEAKKAQVAAARATTQSIKDKDLNVKVVIPINTRATTIINGRTFAGTVNRQTILVRPGQAFVPS